MRDGGKLGGKTAGRGRPKENKKVEKDEKNFTHPFRRRDPQVRDRHVQNFAQSCGKRERRLKNEGKREEKNMGKGTLKRLWKIFHNLLKEAPK
jgi:hypothetical protein